MKPTTLGFRRLSAFLIAAFLAAAAMAQPYPTFRVGTPKNQLVSVGDGFDSFDDCATTLYDPEVYSLADGRLVLWGQGGGPAACTGGMDSLYTATYKREVNNWRVPGATDCPTMIGAAVCDHIPPSNVPDPSGPLGSPSAVKLNGKVYMAYVAGNADYERGKIYWAVGTDVNLITQASPILVPSQPGVGACVPHGIGQVRLVYEAPYFYFIAFYYHGNDPAVPAPIRGALSTLAYRINYDSTQTSGLGSTRQIFTQGQWVAHDANLTFDYGSGGLPIWGNYDGRGLQFAGEGDLKWDPTGGRWIHIFSFDLTRIEWQETTSLANGNWSAPVAVDVSSLNARYPGTKFFGAGLWYGDADANGPDTPHLWAFTPVRNGPACTFGGNVNVFAGLSAAMAKLEWDVPANLYALTISKAGTGSGNVYATVNGIAPAGIFCGLDCSQTYKSGTFVTLTAAPLPSSTFAGWSGDPDCADGSVTMTAARNCIATFNTP